VFILVQRKQVVLFFVIFVSLFSKLFCQITLDHIFLPFSLYFVSVQLIAPFSNCSVGSEIMAMT
jgi:hypothetical protein